jgi:hypothetical protein
MTIEIQSKPLFFSIATLQPWCAPMATKNLDCLGGNRNLVKNELD